MIESKVTYREFEPDIRLQDYIKSYWHFNIHTDTLKTFDVLPDGYFDLLVVIKENKIVSTSLTGIWRKSVSVSYTENTEVFGIRFKPLAIGGLFRFNIKNTLDNSLNVSLDEFDLNEQFFLDSLNSFPHFLVKYLDKQFLKLVSLKKTDLRLKRCFELVDTSIGNVSVNHISDTIGLSARQLHRLVSNMIGIGIKDYSKIIRFKKSLCDVKNNKSNYSHYYDQSHYIREIKHFTGLTPERLDLNNNDRFIQYYNFEQE
ncbi:AraC family transcriptional regulator [Prolixibacteraceae bacterium JC049]|nr:AraC family transcriptional regulator [Prolixibacteraceae bacterium JC049]